MRRALRPGAGVLRGHRAPILLAAALAVPTVPAPAAAAPARATSGYI